MMSLSVVSDPISGVSFVADVTVRTLVITSVTYVMPTTDVPNNVDPSNNDHASYITLVS